MNIGSNVTVEVTEIFVSNSEKDYFQVKNFRVIGDPVISVQRCGSLKNQMRQKNSLISLVSRLAIIKRNRK